VSGSEGYAFVGRCSCGGTFSSYSRFQPSHSRACENMQGGSRHARLCRQPETHAREAKPRQEAEYCLFAHEVRLLLARLLEYVFVLNWILSGGAAPLFIRCHAMAAA